MNLEKWGGGGITKYMYPEYVNNYPIKSNVKRLERPSKYNMIHKRSVHFTFCNFYQIFGKRRKK